MLHIPVTQLNSKDLTMQLSYALIVWSITMCNQVSTSYFGETLSIVISNLSDISSIHGIVNYTPNITFTIYLRQHLLWKCLAAIWHMPKFGAYGEVAKYMGYSGVSLKKNTNPYGWLIRCGYNKKQLFVW